MRCVLCHQQIKNSEKAGEIYGQTFHDHCYYNAPEPYTSPDQYPGTNADDYDDEPEYIGPTCPHGARAGEHCSACGSIPYDDPGDDLYGVEGDDS